MTTSAKETKTNTEPSTTVKPAALVFIGNGAGNIARRSKAKIFEKALKQTKAFQPDQVEWIIMNTESTSLDALEKIIQPTHKVLLGPISRKGLGAGFDRSLGLEAFLESKEELRGIFADEAGQPRYSGVIIVHSELKGTGGGVALPLGLMLRDELGMTTVLFQSIRPTVHEASTIQLSNAFDVVDEILAHGFNTIEIDNDIAWQAAPDDVQVEDIHLSLDQNTVRAWLAMLYLLLKPGSADVSDFNRQILSSEGAGKRMVANYVSFPVPSKKATDARRQEAELAFREGLDQVFNFWGFHIKDQPREMLVVYHGQQFWNKGRVSALQEQAHKFIEDSITDDSSRHNFKLIFGGQDTIDRTTGKHAFVAVMASGPVEVQAYERFQAEMEEKKILSLPPPLPKFAPETALKAISAPDPPLSKASDDALKGSREKHQFLLDRLKEYNTSRSRKIEEFLRKLTPDEYWKMYRGSVDAEIANSPQLADEHYTAFILSTYAHEPSHKFPQEEFLQMTTGASYTLKANTPLSELKEIANGYLDRASKSKVLTRIAFYELFGEKQVREQLAPASTAAPKHQGLANDHDTTIPAATSRQAKAAQ